MSGLHVAWLLLKCCCPATWGVHVGRNGIDCNMTWSCSLQQGMIFSVSLWGMYGYWGFNWLGIWGLVLFFAFHFPPEEGHGGARVGAEGAGGLSRGRPGSPHSATGPDSRPAAAAALAQKEALPAGAGPTASARCPGKKTLLPEFREMVIGTESSSLCIPSPRIFPLRSI